jgi:hypothetical protein
MPFERKLGQTCSIRAQLGGKQKKIKNGLAALSLVGSKTKERYYFFRKK